MKLDSPENTTAVIGIPEGRGVKITSIKANGKYIREDAGTVTLPAGVT